MKKNYVFNVLTAFCFIQCNNNKDPEKISDKHKPKGSNIADLKSSVGGFPSLDVRAQLDKIVEDFEDLSINSKLYPAVDTNVLDGVVQNITQFLISIQSKPGEDIVNKVRVLSFMANDFIRRIRENYCITGQSQSQYIVDNQNFIANVFRSCLENLNQATSIDGINAIISFYEGSLHNFGGEISTLKDLKILENSLDAIKEKYKDSNFPINVVALNVLCGLKNLNNPEFNESYERLSKIFNENRNQDLTPLELDRIIGISNEIIFDSYKRTVVRTVASKSSDFFKTAGYQGNFYTQQGEEVNLTNQEFLTSYASTFANAFDGTYGFCFENNILCLFLTHFSEGEKFSAQIDGLDSALKKGGAGGKIYVYIDHEANSKLLTLDNSRASFLSLDDKVYCNIQELCLRLSAGFNVRKNTTTKDKGLNQAMQCNAEILFKDVQHPSFAVTETINPAIDLQNEGYKYLEYIRYGSVVNLWEQFDVAYRKVKEAASSEDNKQKFNALWTLRNITHYIHQSSLNEEDFLPTAKDSPAGEILYGKYDKGIHVKNGIIDEIKVFWGDPDTDDSFYKETIVDNYDNIRLALAEYLVIRCGLFSDNVHFVEDVRMIKIKPDTGMGFFGMNTLGAWSQSYTNKHDFYKTQIYNDIEAVLGKEDDGLKGIFDINVSSIEGAKIMWDKILNQYLDDGKNIIENFLKIRNQFYKNYPEGIFNITTREGLINYIQCFTEVARQASFALTASVGTPPPVPNSLFKGIVDNILKRTYGSAQGDFSPILRHVETYLASSSEESALQKHIAAYHIKFIENALQGAIFMDCKPAPVIQTLIRINSAKDVERMNLQKLIEANNGNRFSGKDYRSDSETDNFVAGTQESYVKEGYVGLNNVVANICKAIFEDDKKGIHGIWKNRKPKLPFNPNTDPNKNDSIIRGWFDKLKIHIYSVNCQSNTATPVAPDPTVQNGNILPKSARRRILYVGDAPVANIDDIDKKLSDGTLSWFTKGRNLEEEWSIKIPEDYKIHTSPDGIAYVKQDGAKITDFKFKGYPSDYPAGVDSSNFEFLFKFWDDSPKPLIGTFDEAGKILNPGFLFNFDYPGWLLFTYNYDQGIHINYNTPKGWCIKIQNCQL